MSFFQNPTLISVLPGLASSAFRLGRRPKDRSPGIPIRILLAEDHVMVRQGLRVLLEQAGMIVIGEASDGQEGLRLAHEYTPDVAVLDIAMPSLNGLEDGPTAAGDIAPDQDCFAHHAHRRAVRLRGLAGRGGRLCLEDAGGGGHRPGHPRRPAGTIYLSSRVAHTVVQAYLTRSSLSPDPLTSREREIVQRIAEGQTTKEIASALGLSVKTVESHRSNLMRKLDIHETATLVRYAIRRGLTTL